MPEVLKEKLEYPVSNEITFHIEGMRCASCASIISDTIKKLDGVSNCSVNYATDSCKVEYDPTKISKKTIAKSIKDLGYSVNDSFGVEEFYRSQRSTLINFGIATFLAMNIMMLTIPVYWNYFEVIEVNIVNLFGWLMFILCIPVLFINGWGILKRAAVSMFKGYPGMETLIGIGALAAFIYSTIELIFAENPHLYYDTSSTLVVIILFGKFIENHFRYKASQEVNKLNYVLPRKVRIRDIMHNVKWIPADELKIHDLFEVHAGEIIPADGVVINGQALVDESIFTGEARGVLKRAQSRVISGCVLKNGFIQVRATTTVKDSALSSIVKIIENALKKKSNLQNFSDRVARYFIPIIIMISAIVFVVMHSIGFPFESSFLRALTVLVIACPCALALAVPISLVTAYGTLAKNGILIRNPDSLELLNKITDVIFDKTGTLTFGKYEVNKFVSVGKDNELLNKLFILESFSSHPAAEAIKNYLTNKIDDTTDTKIDINTVNLYDYGIRGSFDSEVWAVGNDKMFNNDPHNLKIEAKEKMEYGNTTVFFGKNSVIEGYFSIGDQSRDNIKELVDTLKNKNLNIHLLSGDKIETTKSFAKSVGIDLWLGEQTPYDKINYVKTLRNNNKKVMMIGDGINDAASMTEADIGVALSSGTDLAKLSASMIIFKNYLDKLPGLFKYSAKMKTITMQNFIWAIIYNIVGISLAISGLLNPLIAAVMMMLSSITVVLNSLRLLKF